MMTMINSVAAGDAEVLSVHWRFKPHDGSERRERAARDRRRAAPVGLDSDHPSPRHRLHPGRAPPESDVTPRPGADGGPPTTAGFGPRGTTKVASMRSLCPAARPLLAAPALVAVVDLSAGNDHAPEEHHEQGDIGQQQTSVSIHERICGSSIDSMLENASVSGSRVPAAEMPLVRERPPARSGSWPLSFFTPNSPPSRPGGASTN